MAAASAASSAARADGLGVTRSRLGQLQQQREACVGGRARNPRRALARERDRALFERVGVFLQSLSAVVRQELAVGTTGTARMVDLVVISIEQRLGQTDRRRNQEDLTVGAVIDLVARFVEEQQVQSESRRGEAGGSARTSPRRASA